MRILWRNVLPAKSHDAVRLHVRRAAHSTSPRVREEVGFRAKRKRSEGIRVRGPHRESEPLGTPPPPPFLASAGARPPLAPPPPPAGGGGRGPAAESRGPRPPAPPPRARWRGEHGRLRRRAARLESWAG